MSSAFAENVEFFRPNRQRHSFGTRGSQVQILPLRPEITRQNNNIQDLPYQLIELGGQVR